MSEIEYDEVEDLSGHADIGVAPHSGRGQAIRVRAGSVHLAMSGRFSPGRKGTTEQVR